METPAEVTRQGALRAAVLRLVQPDLAAAIFGLAFALAGLVALLVRAVDTSVYRPDDALLVVLVLAASLPLAAVARWPLAALLVIVAAVCAEAVAGYQVVGAGYWAAGVAAFVTAAFAGGRSAVVAGLVTAAGLLTVFTFERGDISLGGLVGAWAFFSFVYTLGVMLRVYRSTAARAETRAALFAADREARAREAVANERARLARELHDSVGHALNVVVLQAGGARRLLEKRPQSAEPALEAIETAGRQALADIERVLGMLREGGQSDAFEAQPGFADVAALVERVREAGLPVELTVEGEPRALPPSLDLSAYRIVQEALTNAIKHAGKARAWVSVRWSDDHLDIEVLDDGRGATAPSTGGGRGLVGIRERVLLFGGQLAVGPRPEGGFGVWARLPLDAAAAGRRTGPEAGARGSKTAPADTGDSELGPAVETGDNEVGSAADAGDSEAKPAAGPPA